MSDRDVVGHIFSSKDFVYLVNENAFISKIKNTPQVLRYLWADSLDIGFGIKSLKTGNIAYFVLDSVEKDEDGKCAYWMFKVHNPDDDPQLRGLTATVFRD